MHGCRGWTAGALALLLIASGMDAIACRRALTPDLHELSDYDRIFVGEVTGIRLVDYEDYRLRQIYPRAATNDPDAREEFLDKVYVTSATPRFEVTVIMLERIAGPAARTERLALGGCAVPVPTLKQRGLFFVLASDQVIPLFEGSDGFDEWLRKARLEGDR